MIAVQKDHARGLLDDKQAYRRLSALSRQFASEKLGKDVTKHTLAELKRETPDRNSRDGYLALRQTVEALYPPEFAKAEWNPAAQNASVEEAAQWVSGLIERWGE